MVRSMFAGVAGLKSHQQKMDVIGNNIANVNTWGYKAYSFNFQDSIYSTSIRSSEGVTNAGAYGGRNPSQVGYGSSMASISFQYTTGAPSPTDNDLDCMIDGTGLFLVGGMVNGGISDIKSSGLMLTRVGLFTVDNNGYLVDANKNYVYGYALVDGTGIPEVPAQAATAKGSTDVTVGPYDNTNNGYPVTILGQTYYVTATDLEDQVAQWISKATKESKETVTKVPGGAGATAPVEADYKKNPDDTVTITGDATNGWTVTVTTKAGEFANLRISKDSVNANNSKVNLTITTKEMGAGTEAQLPTDATPANGWTVTPGVAYEEAIPAEFEDSLSPIRIPYDPDTGSQYNLQSYSISDTGVIAGIDIENRPITMGQLALIAVGNPNGLEKTSGYYFNIGENAGGVEFVKPGEGPVGFIKSKFLEMPNVDLANEFSNMITTQRGFQANSKMITVSDEILNELVNMKR